MSKDFENYVLKDVLLNVLGGGTPSRNNSKYWNGDIDWASVKDFQNNVFYIDKTEESITKEGLSNSSANLIQKGIPLICTRMAVGRVAIAIIIAFVNTALISSLYYRKRLLFINKEKCRTIFNKTP